MNQHQSTGVGPLQSASLRHVGQNALHVLRKVPSRCGAGVSALLVRLQVGRMESVLRGLSDEHLANIGITRDQISEHAHHLVTYRYDGL